MEYYRMGQDYPIHLRKKEFGEAAGMSWWAVNRLCKAGVAKTVQFPSGERIHADWARQKLENGFSKEELAQLRRYNREIRQGG